MSLPPVITCAGVIVARAAAATVLTQGNKPKNKRAVFAPTAHRKPIRRDTAPSVTARAVSPNSQTPEVGKLLFAFAQRTAGEEPNTKYDVDDVVHLTEH